MNIIGIDPGLNYTGWAVLGLDGKKIIYIDSGVIRINSKLSFEKRLLFIFEELYEIMSQFDLKSFSIEKTLVNSNATSSLKLAHARSSAILAGAKLNLDFYEFLPNEIKLKVTGKGNASKEQVAKMLQYIFPELGAKSNDESDAIAIAYCGIIS